MNTQQLNAIIFLADAKKREVYTTTLKEYLRQYGADETTTPRGIGPRIHIRPKMVDFDGQGNEVYKYEIWSWGPSGNNPRFIGEEFEKEEEAELALYDYYYDYTINKNWNSPMFWLTNEEATEGLADQLGKPVALINRYLQFTKKIA
jgi:hypothetical protein